MRGRGRAGTMTSGVAILLELLLQNPVIPCLRYPGRLQKQFEQTVFASTPLAPKGLASFSLSSSSSTSASSVILEGLSVNDTIATCLAHGHHKEAQRIRTEFKVDSSATRCVVIHGFCNLLGCALRVVVRSILASGCCTKVHRHLAEVHML